MKPEVKIARPEQLAEVLQTVESVFGEDVSDESIEFFQRAVESDRIIYVADGDEMVAGAGAYTFRTTVPGGVLPTGGVTLVGVKTSHRRRGLLTAMMRQQLDDIHQRGEPIATLWASEAQIYPRFGYGLASLQGSFDVARERVRFIDDPGPRGRTRLLPLGDALKPVAQVYDKVRERTPGMFERTAPWWELRVLADRKEWREGASEKYLAVWEDDGEPRAYLIYRLETGWSDEGPAGSVQILELIACDAVALREMLRFALNVDLTDRVKTRIGSLPADSPLPLMIDQPRRLKIRLGDALWLRVVDLKAALEGRSYPSNGTLSFEVRDDFCPWNAGTWSVRIEGGRANVERTDRAPDLTVDAATLGSLYLGTFTFTRMMRAGRLDEHAPGACARADALFASDFAPYCPEIF